MQTRAKIGEQFAVANCHTGLGKRRFLVDTFYTNPILPTCSVAHEEENYSLAAATYTTTPKLVIA